jgi:hypothetical protein
VRPVQAARRERDEQLKAQPGDRFIVYRTTEPTDHMLRLPRVGLLRGELVYSRIGGPSRHGWHKDPRKLSTVDVMRDATAREVDLGSPQGAHPPLLPSTRLAS